MRISNFFHKLAAKRLERSESPLPRSGDVGGQGSKGQSPRPHAQRPVPHWHPQPGTTQQPPQELMDPQKTENWATVFPPLVGLLFPETRSNDVRPQALQPQQSPPWQSNIQSPSPYITHPTGALPIGLDLALMIAHMVQNYMRQ
ncbi:hypothetical protein HPB50_008693 [Hyalomma asiaticum]|uniref:Uncharacterized protein n=1 Tax=Hyalomma asiaticum TaxID=266040 RepID=A0ACB7RSV7_HYAAI|nr:hypothetical protein HPB50_008693 [Hyalomma asiaticum]